MDHLAHKPIYKQWHIRVFITAAVFFLACGAAAAGYSDHSARQSSANNSANTTLKYGGTYGQAGHNYINNRDNWSTPAASGQGAGSPMTAEEKAAYEKLMKKTDSMLDAIFNKPHHFGPRPRQMTPAEQQHLDRTIQQSDDLIQQIENDPLLQ